tara:strand:- start:1113 stop:1559 length:447 start_codon:yes stop_codon:yes gene_type:complete
MALFLDGKQLSYDRAFTHDGIQYPKNWLRLTTLEEKKAIGITEVADESVAYDQKFYWGPDNPKDHTELKTQWIKETKNNAAKLLAETDWYVVRKSETSTAIPTDVATRRAAIRTLCNTKETAINATADTAALATYITGSDYGSWETPE